MPSPFPAPTPTRTRIWATDSPDRAMEACHSRGTACHSRGMVHREGTPVCLAVCLAVCLDTLPSPSQVCREDTLHNSRWDTLHNNKCIVGIPRRAHTGVTVDRGHHRGQEGHIREG